MKSFWRKWRRLIVVAAILILCPILVGGIYSLPLPQIIAIDPSSLITYYGVVFGLMGSLWIYLDERKRREIERAEGSVPDISIDLKSAENAICARIENKGKETVSELSVYDVKTHLSMLPNESQEVLLCFDRKPKNRKALAIWGFDNLCLNKEGFPRYVQLCLTDCVNRGWSMIFERTGSSVSPEYPLVSIELTSW
ncbi:MAG: hypothetical protein V8Q09_03745 [Adlercreutzia sp.]|nr:hypothetical protein [uncultured Adlercreutzia sp.]